MMMKKNCNGKGLFQLIAYGSQDMFLIEFVESFDYMEYVLK